LYEDLERTASHPRCSADLFLKAGINMNVERGRPVALLTGSFRGIGLACARALAASGFDLVLNDLENDANRSMAPGLQDSFASTHCRAEVALADVSDRAAHESFVRAAINSFGRLDCLVNNAGVPPRQRGDLLAVSEESYDRCMAINTKAQFFLAQKVSQYFAAQQPQENPHRSIINITSSNAKAVSILRGEYCMSKAAASMSTQLFALRLASSGVGVYEVRPGIIETEMTAPAKQKYEELIKNGLIPSERWGSPDDVASTVVCMAEGKLRYTVGQIVTVDGGLITPRF
jgi:NAD(P)-dependent dehydrogenase (short-subunit alcohol dehydrogenase family)